MLSSPRLSKRYCFRNLELLRPCLSPHAEQSLLLLDLELPTCLRWSDATALESLLIERLSPAVLGQRYCFQNRELLGPSATQRMRGGMTLAPPSCWRSRSRRWRTAALEEDSLALMNRYSRKPTAARWTTTRIATRVPMPCSAWGVC